MAQSDSDGPGCRIAVDGVVKVETISHEVTAFIFHRLKAA
jgi:Mycobacterium membrane protein